MAEMEWTHPTAASAQRRSAPWLRWFSGHFLDWEDWLTLALMLAATMSVSATLEGGGWSANMPAITAVSVLSVLAAMLLARAGLPLAIAWPLAVLLGGAVTFWQTLIMVGPGTLEQRIDTIYLRFDTWFQQAFTGGVSNDPLPFNVLIIGLTWLGVFLFGWSVFRWHNAWIGLIPGGIALFMDIAFVGDSLSGATLLYILFGFLLIMRTNIVSRMARWRADGVTYPPMISLSFLNFSGWALLLLIAAAWIAPVGPFTTPSPVQALVTGVEELGVNFVRLAGPLRVKKIVPVHNYTGVLPFQGSVSLGERELLSVKVDDPNIQGPIVLRGSVYDEYGSGGWEAGQRDEADLPPNSEQRLRQELDQGDVKGTLVPLQVVVTAKSVVGSIVFSAGQPVSADIPVHIEAPAGSLRTYSVSPQGTRFVRQLPDGGVYLSDEQVLRDYLARGLIGLSVQRGESGRVVSVQAFDSSDQTLPDAAVLQPEDSLGQGQGYKISGFVPAATPEELKAAGRDYPNWVTPNYLQLPHSLPGRVRDLAADVALRYVQRPNAGPAQDVTSTAVLDSAAPYDLAKAVEGYLRSYPVDYQVEDTPPGRDTVDYFLFDSRRGYFDYHASAMVVMLRTLGVPARLGVGFVVDETDLQRESNTYIVRDRNSYAWTEVYFPGHGWVVFNPTPDRPADLSPQARADAAADANPSINDFPNLPVSADPFFDIPGNLGAKGTGLPASTDSGNGYAPWLALGLAAFIAALAASVALGWQRSVAGLPYSQQIWEKTVRLASWAGYAPQPGQTPTDFANGLQRALRELRGVSVLVAAYNRSRFGRRDEAGEERERMTELWPHIRGVLIGAILGRVLHRRRRVDDQG